MSPLLDDATLLNDEYLIRAAYGGKSVGDSDNGALARQPCDGLLDLALRFHVHRGGSFVKHDDRRLTQYGAGNTLSRYNTVSPAVSRTILSNPASSTPPSTTSVTAESSLGTARLTPVNASVASMAAR